MVRSLTFPASLLTGKEVQATGTIIPGTAEHETVAVGGSGVGVMVYDRAFLRL